MAYTAVVTGNVEVQSLMPLAARYFGAIPATHARLIGPTLVIPILPVRATHTIYTGSEAKATVQSLPAKSIQSAACQDLDENNCIQIIQFPKPATK